MVNLSLFMTDPVKAHEEYQKHIKYLEQKHEQEKEELKKNIKALEQKVSGVDKLKEQLRQSKCQVKSLEKKL